MPLDTQLYFEGNYIGNRDNHKWEYFSYSGNLYKVHTMTGMVCPITKSDEEVLLKQFGYSIPANYIEN